jgi:broad specificity phosphatase PhoE
MAAEQRDPDIFLSLKNGATELYLIRHADALPDAEGVVHGDYDAQALSEVGRRQARALAERMRTLPLDAVYSSPTSRAHETARYVAETHGLEVHTERDLREVELGPIGAPANGDVTREDLSELLRQRLRDIAVIAVTTGDWSSIPGSEPSGELRARLVVVVERIAAAHPGQRVALFSHGGAINAYCAAILGIPRDYFVPLMNTSLSVVRVKETRHLLFTLNDVAHLWQSGHINDSRPAS